MNYNKLETPLSANKDKNSKSLHGASPTGNDKGPHHGRSIKNHGSVVTVSTPLLGHHHHHDQSTSSSSPVRLQREIRLLEAVAIIIGSIIGSGIFVSPKGVLAACGSLGVSLIVWICCGLLSMSGSLCYAELGTTFPGSGGTYHYLGLIYGPTIAFLFFWISVFITGYDRTKTNPCSMAILSLTFAKYATQAFSPATSSSGCPNLSDKAMSMLAASTMLFIIFLNCHNVRGTVRTQNVFMVAKISALTLIILGGMVYLLMGHTENFSKPFQNTVTDPGSIAISFYSGFFSYRGWTALNILTEELREPTKNLPRAIHISVPTITFIYVLVNAAYFAVLSPSEILSSDAIAVTFGEKLFGSLGGTVISLCVAISTFGGLMIHAMASSRLLFVAAREGHCPRMLSHINVARLTPTPALIFLGFLSLFTLTTSNVYVLIGYTSFIDNFAHLVVIVGLLLVRRQKPDLERPIKVPLFYPIVYLVTCILAVALPIYVNPVEIISAILVTMTGLPVFYFFVNRALPNWLAKIMDEITCLSQRLFMATHED